MDRCSSALLMGCSSGRLRRQGDYEPAGAIWAYLLAGGLGGVVYYMPAAVCVRSVYQLYAPRLKLRMVASLYAQRIVRQRRPAPGCALYEESWAAAMGG